MELSTDVVIVGAGIAGSLVAEKLAAAGYRVVVLEAGPRVHRSELLSKLQVPMKKGPTAPYPFSAHAPSPNPGSPDDYYVQSGPDLFKSTYLRVVGGTTWHWQGTVPRFLPEDLRLHTTHGVGIDWPFDYETLEPFYLRAEKELGVAGDSENHHGSSRSGPYPMPAVRISYLDECIGKAVKPLGLDVASLPQARTTKVYDGRPACCGNATCIPVCPIQSKYDATVHLSRAEKNGVRVMENCVVNRLEVGPDARVSAVSFKRPDRSVGTVRGKYFFIAAHAIETAKLLLISRSESRPMGIANSSGLVGRNLMDHPIWLAWALTKEPMYPFRAPLVTSGIENFRRGTFRPKSAAFRIDINNDGWSWPVGGPESVAKELIERGLRGSELADAISQRTSRQFNLVAYTEQLPDPQNRIEPAWDRLDPLGIPRPKITYRLDDYSHRGLAAAKESVQKIFRAVGCSEEYHAPEFRGAAHIAGTFRMGTEPNSSVVTPELKTHDHSNLYLLGSGVFPTIGTANPTLTIAALTLRAVEHFLKSESKK